MSDAESGQLGEGPSHAPPTRTYRYSNLSEASSSRVVVTRSSQDDSPEGSGAGDPDECADEPASAPLRFKRSLSMLDLLQLNERETGKKSRWSPQAQVCSILQLPTDVLYRIADDMSPTTMLCLARTCRRMSRLLLADSYTVNRLQRRCGTYAVELAARLNISAWRMEQLCARARERRSATSCRLNNDSEAIIGLVALQELSRFEAFLYACQYGLLPLFHRILCSCASAEEKLLFINQQCGEDCERHPPGFSGLHCAAERSKNEVVDELLRLGANVHLETYDNTDNSGGHTALHYACEGGNFALVRSLLHAGANVNATAHNGGTPLRYACRGGSRDVVLLLLRHGAQEDEGARLRGLSAAHVAAMNNREDLVQLLHLFTIPLDDVNTNGATPLHLAAGAGALGAAKILLQNGVCVNGRSRDGVTPLHAAAESGHVDLCTLLIEHGADVNKPDQSGELPMHDALRYCHMDVVEVLVSAGSALFTGGPGFSAPITAAGAGIAAQARARFPALHRA